MSLSVASESTLLCRHDKHGSRAETAYCSSLGMTCHKGGTSRAQFKPDLKPPTFKQNPEA